jgi:polysaccharide pyruvyl transferase WcaK-like protein
VLRGTLAAGDLFTIRDPDSLELAREIGLPAGKPVRLTADAALNHRPAPQERIEAILRALDLPPGRPRVGVNVNAYLDTWARPRGERVDRGRFVATMAAVADRMVRAWRAAVIFFVTQHMDRRITEAVRRAMEEREATRVLSNEDHSPEELQGAMGHLELFLGTRFHSLLLAASLATPIVGLVYQAKVASLFRQLGRPEGAISFEGFGVEEIWAKLAACWDDRAAIRERLRRAVADLKARALEAADETARCLAG